MEEAELRSCMEKLQARLQACGVDSPQQVQAVLESLVMKKQSLCEMLQSWNGRLQDVFQQEKGRSALLRPPEPRQTQTDHRGEQEWPGVLPSTETKRTVTSAHCPPPPPSCWPSPGGDPAADPFTPGPSFTEQDSLSLPEDVFDGHLLGSTDSQVKEKSTMKAILANFLPGNSYNSIPFP
ncbi:hypothetical protein KUCAC02_035465, partial [Chaenocephalus aceratus]